MTTEKELLEANIDEHGFVIELVVAMEECAELAQAISKIIRDRTFANKQLIDHLSEEMADVTIMLDELGMIFKNTCDVAAWRKRKLERMEKRLEETENE